MAPPLAWPKLLTPSAPSPARETLPVSVQLVMVITAPCSTLLTAAAPVLAPAVPMSWLCVKVQLVKVAGPSWSSSAPPSLKPALVIWLLAKQQLVKAIDPAKENTADRKS